MLLRRMLLDLLEQVTTPRAPPPPNTHTHRNDTHTLNPLSLQAASQAVAAGAPASATAQALAQALLQALQSAPPSAAAQAVKVGRVGAGSHVWLCRHAQLLPHSTLGTALHILPSKGLQA